MIRDGSPLSAERLPFFDTLLIRAQEDAMDIIHRNYEDQPNLLDNLDYHIRGHSLLMKTRATMLLKTMQLYDPAFVSAYDIHLGGLAAVYHDTVQKWEVQEVENNGFTILKRKRFVGQNEWESTVNTLSFMDRINAEYGGLVYRDDDKKKVTEAIKVTIPGFDPTRGTVIQPHLIEGVGPITVALALSDLGTAGLSGGLAYQLDGDQLFREENLDVKLAIAGKIHVGESQIQNMKERMLQWTGSQVQFAKGRQDLLVHETSFLPESVRRAVQQKFDKFPESIQHAADLFERRKQMSYTELFQDMGYSFS